MSAAVELDPLKHALKLLFSPNPDSAEKIRLLLDEIIKQRHGSSKMLINTLNKKYLAEESQSPGTSVKRRRTSEPKPSNSSKNATTLPPEAPTAAAETVISINISDLKTIDVSEEENLKEFGDLACVVCGAMVVAPGNRLIECADCHSLYHQECHKPHISDDDANEQEFSWCCTNCKNKVMMLKTAISVPSPSKSSSSHSSSSSSSSSHSYYNNNTSGNGNGNSKGYEERSSSKSSSKSTSHKSNSSKSKGSGASAGSSSSPLATPSNNSNSTSTMSSSSPSGNNSTKNSSVAAVTPNINIISVDKRLQIMRKKAAKQQESKRKHK